MPRYNLIYISPFWHEDLKEILDIVATESEDRNSRSLAKSLLSRLDYMGVQRDIDRGELAQIVVTDKEQRFIRSLASAVDIPEMVTEFSHVRPKRG